MTVCLGVFLALKVATFWMVRVGKNTLKCIGFEKYVNRNFAQNSYLKWAKIHDCEATAYNQQYSEYWTLRRSDIDNVRVDGQRQERTWLWLRTVKTNQLGHSNYYYYFFFEFGGWGLLNSLVFSVIMFGGYGQRTGTKHRFFADSWLAKKAHV